MIIDTHAHYDDKAFEEDRSEVLESMAGEGIGRIVNIGSSLGACKRTIQLMEQYDFIYGASCIIWLDCCGNCTIFFCACRNWNCSKDKKCSF